MGEKPFGIIYETRENKFTDNSFDRFYNEAKKLGKEIPSLIPGLSLEKISRDVIFKKFYHGQSFWTVTDHEVGNHYKVQESRYFVFKKANSEYEEETE